MSLEHFLENNDHLFPVIALKSAQKTSEDVIRIMEGFCLLPYLPRKTF